MKPAFESVKSAVNSSFLVRKFSEKKFSAPYHFHPEYELTYILTGSGKRYVGNSMQDYSSGDLVLLGTNLPHCWKTEDEAMRNSISVVIHFNRDFLGTDFFEKPEMAVLLQLLDNSNYGLQFTGDNNEIKKNIISLSAEKNSFKRMISFLEILYELSCNRKFVILNKQNYYSTLSKNDKQRINEVIGYIVDNFQNSISLKEAASIANMTTHAFCKYFKRITRKTFMEAVNDYRIDFATRQLTTTNKTVSEIGFESGFNEISNFHKKFKRKVRYSPLIYRNMFLKKMG